jgi:hypothetical protein
MRSVRLAGLFTLLCCVHGALAADVKVPAEVKVAPGRLARIVCESAGKEVKYVNVYPGADIFREYDPKTFIFRFLADAPGRYRLAFYAPDAAGGEPAYCDVIVGDPPPPVPPGPTPPGPVPPGPTPGDNPFPADGKARALILFDNTQPEAMPAGLWNQVYGAAFRDYLRQKTSNEYRIWPADTAAGEAGPEWAQAMQKKPDKLPWIYLSNGKTGYSGPLPATRDETMKLMQKYGL